MNLTGILKSVLLVFAAIIIWSTPISSTQAIGYGIALVGLLIYALPDDMVRQSAVVELALTTAGVWAVRIGNRLGLLGLGNTRRGSEGGSRYTSVPDGVREDERDDGSFAGSFALEEVEGEGSEGRRSDMTEKRANE